MNSKETKQIRNTIKKQWEFEDKLDYAFIKSDKDKLYIINKEIEKINFENLKINSIGLYLGELKNNQLRLSIEGSQLIGPKAKKNVIELDKIDLKEWLKGEEIETIDKTKEGFVIIKNKNDYLGTGKVKDGKILNYVPKTRRLEMIESQSIEFEN